MIGFEIVETGFGNTKQKVKGQSPRMIRLRPVKQEVPENVRRLQEKWKEMKSERSDKKVVISCTESSR